MTHPADDLERRFLATIAANLTYWRAQTAQLSQSQFGTLDAEWPNIVRAVRYGGSVPEFWVATTGLAVQVHEYVEARARWFGWIELAQALAERVDAPDPVLACRLLDQVGQLYRLEWRLPEALAMHERAEAMAVEAGALDDLARIHFSLSEDYRAARRPGEAETYGQLALRAFEQAAGAPARLAAVLNGLALTAHLRGDYPIAEARFAAAAEHYRTLDRPTDLARVLTNAGATLEAAGRPNEAMALFAQARAWHERAGNALELVKLEQWVGTLFFNRDQLDEAEAAFRRADAPLLNQPGFVGFRAVNENNLGNVRFKQGRLAEAEVLLRKSSALWRQINQPVQLANTIGTLGEVALRLNHPDEAGAAFSEAVALLADFPDDAWARKLSDKFAALLSQVPRDPPAG